MSNQALRTGALAVLLAAGALVGFTEPAFACHEPTGWCCQDGSDRDNSDDGFCCYFEDNQIQPETCG